jgi:DNA-binding transcriptional ArsR family regulator
MIRIPLTATGLAGVRFVVSPLFEAVAALCLLRRQHLPASSLPWAARARTVLTDRRLVLLAALISTRSHYIPDFITPQPRSFQSDPEEELHRVATTPRERVAGEIAAMVTGRARAGVVGGPLPSPLRAALDRGESAFARRLADELGVLWSDVLASHWARLRGALEEDVDRRARVMSRCGSGALWSTFGPRVDWNDGVLCIESRFDVEVRWGETVILVPSMIAPTLGEGVDPCSHRTTFLVYPARPGRSHASAGPGQGALADVLGHTRAALLASLTSPRSTTELSRMHHLTPATVSYHLTRLHRGGLVTRVRQGQIVLYQWTDSAKALVTEGDQSL